MLIRFYPSYRIRKTNNIIPIWSICRGVSWATIVTNSYEWNQYDYYEESSSQDGDENDDAYDGDESDINTYGGSSDDGENPSDGDTINDDHDDSYLEDDTMSEEYEDDDSTSVDGSSILLSATDVESGHDTQVYSSDYDASYGETSNVETTSSCATTQESESCDYSSKERSTTCVDTTDDDGPMSSF